MTSLDEQIAAKLANWKQAMRARVSALDTLTASPVWAAREAAHADLGKLQAELDALKSLPPLPRRSDQAKVARQAAQLQAAIDEAPAKRDRADAALWASPEWAAYQAALDKARAEAAEAVELQAKTEEHLYALLEWDKEQGWFSSVISGIEREFNGVDRRIADLTKLLRQGWRPLRETPCGRGCLIILVRDRTSPNFGRLTVLFDPKD